MNTALATLTNHMTLIGPDMLVSRGKSGSTGNGKPFAINDPNHLLHDRQIGETFLCKTEWNEEIPTLLEIF